MSVEQLMHYFDISLDDIRWYLSDLMAFKLLQFQSNPQDLVRYIWSKELESELYNIEENFVNQLKNEIDQERIDESHLRDLFKEIQAKKVNRFQSEES